MNRMSRLAVLILLATSCHTWRPVDLLTPAEDPNRGQWTLRLTRLDSSQVVVYEAVMDSTRIRGLPDPTNSRAPIVQGLAELRHIETRSFDASATALLAVLIGVPVAVLAVALSTGSDE